ncbi:uncharacterized protein FIBRA_04813 [Fibroporia radiculosa]|uniref:N-acetyltransferase domain-containing protein n=1 Tax=Fibroporia radiculosa TaxID=599839 RepID=J4HWR2_9APHY|nr:uncharacterized protein FIBRA_04813 [Fibroporia radiculosa]CCM02707.1 predicted protein [Fibroporia radiculosa]
MRCNENTIIVDKDVVLVPYRPEHVAKYHEWMTSAELRELTASEPLTLEEEYEMQQKWQTDEDTDSAWPTNNDPDLPLHASPIRKHPELTFIILARPRDADDPSAPSTLTHADGDDNLDIHSLPMVGDVNLFLKGTPEDEDFEAEAEVMIAEPAFRRRGLALAALELMLSYATSPSAPAPLPVPRERLVARIAETNEPSVRLFERLGFAVTRRVEVFQELEMRWGAKEGAHVERWREGVTRTLQLRNFTSVREMLTP